MTTDKRPEELKDDELDAAQGGYIKFDSTDVKRRPAGDDKKRWEIDQSKQLEGADKQRE